MRQAWTSGGVEWNYSPGYCGHVTSTLSPVYVATLPTERGEMVRLWEYDRVNGTTWQVDVLLEGDTLWVHPKLRNLHATRDLNGYWWTNAAMPAAPAGRERVLMPAKYTAMWPAHVLWPHGQYFLTPTPFGFEERGWTPKQNFSGLDHSFWADYSWLGNLPTGNSKPSYGRMAKQSDHPVRSACPS